MPDHDLCAAVFELKLERRLPSDRLVGRALQKILLSMLSHMTLLTGDETFESLVQKIHPPKHKTKEKKISSAPLPYTVSNLAEGDRFLWIRVTGLVPEMCTVLEALVAKLPGQTVTVRSRDDRDEKPFPVSIQTATLSAHDWTGQTSYENFIKANWKRPPAELRLEFIKPVIIESWGIYRLFPEPTTIFRVLYERVQKIEGIRLPFRPEANLLELFILYFTETIDYQICLEEEDKLERKVIGFTGWAAYRVIPKNKSLVRAANYRLKVHNDAGLKADVDHLMNNHEAYACLVNLLSAFAFYSGLGGYTGGGMGLVRKVG